MKRNIRAKLFFLFLIFFLTPIYNFASPPKTDLDDDVLKEIRDHYDSGQKANKFDRDLGIPKVPKARFFSIQPGGSYDFISDLDISGRGRSAAMTTTSQRSNFFFDIRSKDFKINEAFGVQLLFHSARKEFDKQSYSVPAPDTSSSSDSSSSSSSSSSSGQNDKNSVTADLGTNVKVDYNYIIPTFYWGNPDVDGFRMGVGFGLADIRMRGNVDFRDPGEMIGKLYGAMGDRNTFLNTLSFIQLSSGLVDLRSGDPLFNYLLLNLSQGNNLELMGAYLASQGTNFSTDILSLLVYTSLKDDYNPLELLALSALSRTSINAKDKQVFAYMIYVETPKFGFVKARLSWHGPLFKDSGYTIHMSTLELALMIPINF
ncbi:hypothetical protein AB3N61_03490 [Leptospira sp. WS58.C1]|uniref:hypothetical protein n=1 Tax=Leptospira TaxID=171 RepID=UPI0002BD6B80|nr:MULTISPECIES: hypothetical protein [unclassified Leptospira]EMJ97458.1 hypothetical protein LEP1GSC192_3208 [Leptospira sp. B5-022]MCR1795554.1 hypothetical protein [Leptospira sp. id769339]